MDAGFPIDCGVRAEIVARVSAGSFRAVGEVGAIRGRSGVCIEFVRLSTGGKDMLADLIAELERLQAVMNELESASTQIDRESFRRQLENGRQASGDVEQTASFSGKVFDGRKRRREFRIASCIRQQGSSRGNASFCDWR